MGFSRRFMLARSRARDRAYDGRFITGVLSTGIYCLPSCPARNPNEENVRFFATQEEAAAVGLRACKRCKPDDFYRDRDPDLERTLELAAALRAAPGDFADADAMRAHTGFGGTKLTELFRRHYHVTPAAFLVRERVRRACRELLGSRRRVLDIALDAGFESSSAFHENFRRWTAMTPRAYRELAREPRFPLSLPADFRWDHAVRYLARDTESATERRVGDRVEKGVTLAGRPALLSLTKRGTTVACEVHARSERTPERMAAAHRTAVSLLGLHFDPVPFERRVARMKGMRSLVDGRAGLRISLTADPFEALAWAVIGQQINLPFAFALRRRLARKVGSRVAPDLVAHPTPAQVARLEPGELRELQFSQRKAEYLIDAARAASAGELNLEELGEEPAGTSARVLGGLRGFGPWTVNYVQMRGFGLADCVPVGDAGLRTSLQRFFELAEKPNADETCRQLEPFAPFRSLACYHFWNLLGDSA